MKHLTDEQLSARLDGELPAKAAEAAVRHLAECDACRERLAALSGSDEALSQALGHDPGEKYFESFAGRVQARIEAGAATAGSREARVDAAPSNRGWLQSPSKLAWAGTATALVAAGAFAIQFATQQFAGGRPAAVPQSIVGADSRQPRAAAPAEGVAMSVPPPATEPGTDAPATEAPEAATPAPTAATAPTIVSDDETATAGGSAARDALRSRTAQRQLADAARAESAPREQSTTAPRAKEEDERASAAGRKNAVAPPQRLQELRTLPGGEQVPVQSRPLPQAEKQKAFAESPTDATTPRKPAAMPMAPAPQAELEKKAASQEIRVRGGRADDLKLGATTAPTAPAPVQASGAITQTNEAASGVARAEADETATSRLCGTVSNAQGLALAGATVTVVETGRSVVSGADGAFCVEAPAVGATLSVLSLGYQEFRATVRDEQMKSPYAVSLRSVETLGPGSAPTGRLETVPPPTQWTSEVGAFAKRSLAAKDAPRASVPTTIAPQPGETPDASAAREATEAAMRARTVPSWSKAGALWTGVAAAAKTEAAANEARYRAAEARMNAWRLARGSSNRRAAAAAIAAYLAKAPAGAQRASVEAWRAELPER